MYDPTGSEPANEWVEIANPTDTPISISGLIFEDNVASFTIPSGNTVPAQGYFVLGYCRQPPAVDLVYGTTASIQLSNPGDTVTFRTDTLIDRVAPASGVGETASLSRKFSGSQPEPDQLGEEHPYSRNTPCCERRRYPAPSIHPLGASFAAGRAGIR